MARNKVLSLWTTIVTAFFALCAALGLVSATASAAVPQTETPSSTECATQEASPATASWSWSRSGSLPPTMKQRIHAEAHGTAPSCRLCPVADPAAATSEPPCDDTTEPPDQHSTPLQR
ncbi:DUF6344 domain-containing protein [Streptomyces lancefieldiae]|uniref:DUF6344 domain-containing protein n=1 Tax=Streptomyces lancefieldiae TaxID=3075520 RepID=A0ABU3AIE8_9ACTN|nr:DUF6344 domain-containing protein [Streptomyces sp. DSM 40712]MDT0609675.1 DUF6344 domain-containing protein [Streptomyces sp. DSM 40712]